MKIEIDAALSIAVRAALLATDSRALTRWDAAVADAQRIDVSDEAIAYAAANDDSELDRRIRAAPSNEHATWSVLEVVDEMNKTAFAGSNLRLLYKDHWGPKPIEVQLTDNPTWNDLFIAGASAIEKSGDSHHRFIEGFVRAGDLIIMSTGS